MSLPSKAIVTEPRGSGTGEAGAGTGVLLMNVVALGVTLGT